MSEFTDRDRKAIERMRKNARLTLSDPSATGPVRGRAQRINAAGREIMKRHPEIPAPTWSRDERLSIDFDFLRTGRTPDQRRRGVYASTMYYGVLSRRERERLRDAHLEAGRTGYPFSVTDEPYHLTDLDEPFELSPATVRDCCVELIEDDLMPVVQLLAQSWLKPIEQGGKSLDELEAYMRLHAEAWGSLAAIVWLTFEHNERGKALYPKDEKEGLRGDDWITALAGRAARVFGPDAIIVVHQTAGEHHDHTDWAAGGKAGEEPGGDQVVLGFQFHGWHPDPDAVVEYRDGDSVEFITSGQAHERDLVHMIERHGHEYPILWLEYGQEFDDAVDEWTDEQVFELGAWIKRRAAELGALVGTGCGS